MNQIHTKFKIFRSKLPEDKSIQHLKEEIEKFVNENQVSPKSIGVEYLEDTKQLIMTLGYRDDQSPHSITIESVYIGRLDNEVDTSAIEQLMIQAADKQHNIICHELYITDNQEFFMVFMLENIS